MSRLLEQLAEVVQAAGREILELYRQQRPVKVTVKADNSPVTEADHRANAVIEQRLRCLEPRLPIVSEEGGIEDYRLRRHWSRYWLVDPLDGTREFINGNGEFTVNIALVEDGVATVGAVHAPVQGVSWLGRVATGCWKIDSEGRTAPLSCKPFEPATGVIRIVVSRSHGGANLERLVERLRGAIGQVQLISAGSSLKICLLAEGKADLCLRPGPTSEWDTAAAHAVLAAAGGAVVDTHFRSLRYNRKAGLLNPPFLAFADPARDWRGLLGQLSDWEPEAPLNNRPVGRVARPATRL